MANEPERRDPEKTARDAVADIGEAGSVVARAAGSAIDRVGKIAGELVSGGTGGGDLLSSVVPEVRPATPLEPGSEVAARVRLVNEADAATEPFDLSVTELVSDAGDRIPAEAVSLPPHQRVVAAHGSDTVLVTVDVPSDAAPGMYRGELKPSDAGVQPAPVVVHVR
jgi:hypothetical protein